MKRSTRSVRAVLIAVSIAPGLALVQAAPAAAHHQCTTYPGTPYMSNYKTEEITGRNIGACARQMQVIVARSQIQLWSRRTASYETVGEAEGQAHDATYVEAYARTSCATLGAAVKYRSRGQVTGVWDFFVSDQDGWKPSTYAAVFDCSPPPLRDINP